ncbi:ABC transporter permease [Clostridium kluyveri]|uniref:ABC transporter permease n=1 Tax=Clostridium kluyveri TaxID=1534 RepID=UPI002246F44B|nr:FtsX-like permease family protein [Clostridium kluyveri]UZQ49040.1 ABC transporter permease [Clostridium kluyveri]
MITSFWGLAKKFIITNKVRVILSVLSIILSVGLVVTIFSLVDNMEKSYKQEIKYHYGDMDLMVGVKTFTHNYLLQDEVDKIKSTAGVESTSEVLMEPQLSIRNVNDESRHSPGVYTVGVDNSFLAKSRYKNSKDIGENEIIINKGLASTLNVKVFDKVKVELPNVDPKICKIVEVIPDIKGAAVDDTAMLNINFLQKWCGLKNKSTFILLKLKNGTDKLKTEESLKTISKNLRVDVIEMEEEVQTNIQNIKVMGCALGALSIIISVLFIFSNFRLFIYEYKHELAVMRSVGGNSQQSFKLILIQAVFIVLSGSILGLGLSYLCTTFLSNLFSSLFGLHITNFTFRWKYAVEICILSDFLIMAFLIFPAINSTKILPIQAMRENEQVEYKKSNVRKWMALISISIGVLFVIDAFLINAKGRNSGLIAPLGGIIIIIGVFWGFTYFIKPIFEFLSPIWNFFGGRIGFIAVKNIIPQMKQNTMVVLSLAGAITIAITGVSILESIKINSNKVIQREYVSDIVLTSRYGLNSKLKYNFKKEIEKIKGVKEAIPLSYSTSREIISMNSNVKLSKGDRFNYIIGDIDELAKNGFLPKVEGDKRSIAVFQEDYAKKFNLKVGDEIKVIPKDIPVNQKEAYKGETVNIKVAAIVHALPGSMISNHCIVDWRNKYLQDNNTILDRVLIQIDKANKEDVLKGLNDLKTKNNEIKWSTLQEALADSNQMLKQRFSLLIIAIIVTLLIGVSGIVVTLNSHIQAQRREYAILRAISITPLQLFKIVLSQGLLYSLVGAFLGTASGTIMLYSIVLGMGETVSIPWNMILYIIVGMILSSLILTLPLAKRISNKSIVKELNNTVR